MAEKADTVAKHPDKGTFPDENQIKEEIK